MYDNLKAGDRVRITHPTGITETATVDSIIRRDFPALYVTYTDRTTGRVSGEATVEKIDDEEADPRPACRHGESMWGRCAFCGMTWAQQEKAAQARVSTLGGIERERFGYGDPVDVVLRAATAFGGHWLHKVVYDNGRYEYATDEQVNQCSANAGGDLVSGCDTFINPYATDGLCSKHRVASQD